ncbi:uncharacterized protein J4E84_004402 [Alternaria hordeiaustralica]|uniref:uncharacterized protein n=1 Tax=Alternaria hordeiaustralica TaxID=1187925 RepID=UPI0020C57EDD|nr:uncharacterized protein J4E84_004402 [Alternaria hordeiaustralica]KAI4690218.1 hypothetical protein J4E84_004402 [Alternaria hordeiaustralica]
MSNLHDNTPALTSLDPVTPSPPLLPEARPTSTLLTTLRAHQTMLTDLYIAQNNAYIAAYTAFETQYAAATGTTFIEMQEAIAKLLEQQKEVMSFQTLLWSFQMFVAGLESGEKHDLDEGQARGQEGFGSGGARGFDGMWR